MYVCMYIDTCVCVYIYICLRTSAKLNQMAVRFSNQNQYQMNRNSIDKQSNGGLKKSPRNSCELERVGVS